MKHMQRSIRIGQGLTLALLASASLYAQKTAPQPIPSANAPYVTKTPPWPAEASKLRLHMIGNAHVDAPWLWPPIRG
jgi:hypothetical protein